MKPRKHGLITIIGSLSVLVFVAGCASHRVSTEVQGKGMKEERVEEPLARLPVLTPEQLSAMAPANAAASAPISAPPPAPVVNSLYLFDIPFQFDRFTLRFDARSMVEVNAMRLKEANRRSLMLEGRCDEVGTTEYNLVLGERRAHTVKQYLVNLGIPPSSIEIVSYGKDKPVCGEHSEDCWAKNRTVHFMLR